MIAIRPPLWAHPTAAGIPEALRNPPDCCATIRRPARRSCGCVRSGARLRLRRRG